MPAESETPSSHGIKKSTSITKVAKPARKIFDAWNSSSTGHQRAENRLSGSTSWRQSRTRKLHEQFNDRTGGGGPRLTDTVGAGSEDFGKDGRTEDGGWMRGVPGLRVHGQRSLQESLDDRRAAEEAGDDGDGPRRRKRRKTKENEERDEVDVAPADIPSPEKLRERSETSPPAAVAALSQEAKKLSFTYEPPGSQSAKPTSSPEKLSQHSSLGSSASAVTADAGFSPTSDTSTRKLRSDKQARRSTIQDADPTKVSLRHPLILPFSSQQFFSSHAIQALEGCLSAVSSTHPFFMPLQTNTTCHIQRTSR